MEKFERYLFYYSLLASSLIFIGATFFSPTPHNYFLMALFLPITFFFWLRMSLSGKEVSQNTQKATLRWSGRLLIIVFLLAALGIFAQFLSTRNKNQLSTVASLSEEDKLTFKNLQERLEESEKENQTLLTEIAEIKSRLTDLVFSEDEKSILGEEIDNLPVGYVTINNDSTLLNVKVYKDPDQNSKILGQLKYAEVYPFLDKNDAWYLVEYKKEASGWVELKYLKEIVEVSP